MIKITKTETKLKPIKKAGEGTQNKLTGLKVNELLQHKAVKDILKSRAQAMAMGRKDERILKELTEIIEFRLATETYGIETEFVREVYPLKDYTIIPGLPTFVMGIINVRGQIISIINLKKFFSLPEKGLGELNKVIIIKNQQMEFGILADVINGTYSIAIDTIQKSLSDAGGIGANYLKGVTSEHLILLDANKILADKKIIINQETE